MATFSDYVKNIFLILLILSFAPALIKSFKKQYFDFLKSKTQVAYLPITGIVYDSSYYSKYLKKFFKNKDIKAILLKIESPGSAAGSAEAIANEIELLKKEYPKPIITLTENLCTSGAYYIACTTDYIIAPPSAFVGSIGTQIPYLFKLKDFIEHYKIHYEVIKAGEYKTATDPFTQLTPEQTTYLQTLVNDSYQNFLEHTARHRPKLLLANASTWADGKLFTGRQALQLGLIDEVGSRSNAIAKIKELGIIEDKIEWIEPAKEGSIFSRLFSSSDSFDTSEISSVLMKLVKMHTNDYAAPFCSK